MLEYEAHHEEVRWNSYGEYAEGCQLAAETNPKEEVEQNDVQAIIHEMGSAEAYAVLGRSLLLEGEMGGHVIIGEETDDVSDRIGHIDVDPVLEDPVDDIVYRR